MIHSETQLTLVITKKAEEDSQFSLLLSADDVPLADETVVDKKTYLTVHHMADACRQLLKTGGNPELSSDTITSVGTELFAAWFAPFWPATKKLLASNQDHPCHITITSNEPDILLLPWELLQFPDGTIPSMEEKFGIRRLPASCKQASRCCPTLPPGPLKLLFMAATPTNSGEIDHAEEEAALRQILAQNDVDICLEVADSGTFAELETIIHQFQPHLVHLVGPALVKNESGYFGFEDEIGNADIRSANELYNDLFKNTGVQGVIISGRDLSRPSPVAALGAIAGKLVELGLPLALSWGESLTNPLAAAFAQRLYRELGDGKTIDHALAESRRSILGECETSGYPGWILPMLFSTTNQSRIFNNSPQAPRIRPRPMSHTLPAMPGLALSPVLNHRLQRRPVQRLLPQLLDGSLQTLLITGPEGSGKSTLASHLAQNLERAGFTPIAISGTETTPLTTARVLASVEKALRQAYLKDELEILTNPKISKEDRLGFVAAVMNRRNQFVMILDGMEWSLNKDSNRFYDPTMAPFFFYMLDQLNGKSRFIATSRVTPVSGGPAPLPATYRAENLAQLSLFETKPVEIEVYNQNNLSKAAIFQQPVPIEGIAAVMGVDSDKAKAILEIWQQDGLALLDEQDIPAVWHIIRPLPKTLPQLDEKSLQTGNKAAGEYLLNLLKTSKTDPLQRTWFDIATTTIEHFLAADDFEQALAVTEQVNIYLDQMGFFWQMEKINSRVLQHQQHPQLLYNISVAQQHQNRMHEAAATLEQILAICGGTNAKEEALALFDLAAIDLQTGTVTEAVGRLNSALAINRVRNENKGIVACLTHIGMILIQANDGESALIHLEEALEIQRQHATKEDVVLLLPWIGDIHFRQGDIDKAKEMFNEALPILQELAESTMEAQVLHQLATIDLNDGEYLQSFKRFEKSLTIKTELNDKKGCAATFFQLGRLAKEVGQQDSCMRFIGLCHLLDKEIGNPDAEQERKIFNEIIESFGLEQKVAEDILADIWNDYKLDAGLGLVEETFKKLTADKK
ncbi:MAG: tetratricopeptide repeat protein [Magnetococcales bacterium]|nr:tetratricopeptide repeat protein [Magnetococcales bacterium]